MNDEQKMKLLRFMCDTSNQLTVVAHDLSTILPQTLDRLTGIGDTLDDIHKTLLRMEMKK